MSFKLSKESFMPDFIIRQNNAIITYNDVLIKEIKKKYLNKMHNLVDEKNLSDIKILMSSRYTNNNEIIISAENPEKIKSLFPSVPNIDVYNEPEQSEESTETEEANVLPNYCSSDEDLIYQKFTNYAASLFSFCHKDLTKWKNAISKLEVFYHPSSNKIYAASEVIDRINLYFSSAAGIERIPRAYQLREQFQEAFLGLSSNNDSPIANSEPEALSLKI